MGKMKPKSRKFSRLLSIPRAWRQKQLEDHMTAVGPAAISTLAGGINEHYGVLRRYLGT